MKIVRFVHRCMAPDVVGHDPRMSQDTPRTVGVEEELMLVDPDSGELTAVAEPALHAHRQDREESPEVENELFLQQLETSTEPCVTADELVAEIRRGRRAVGEAARSAGASAVAMPTAVLVDDEQDLTPKPRYQRIEAEYGELARQSLVCAMHVHVEVDGDDEGVAVIDRIRPWLPVLVALSANSPYWRGVDTRHASWRSQIWSRWPSGGPQEPFGDVAGYRRTAARMMEWGASLDPGMLYFDVRLSESFPTVEIRVADVCTEVDDALLVALLARALTETAARDRRSGAEPPAYRADLLRVASWRAGRFGLGGPLVHPLRGEPAETREVVSALLDHVGPVLEEAGETDLVRDLFERMVGRGGGATRQRRVFERTGELRAVVQDLVQRTEESWAGAG
jgi:glutamate---cysteine ligase / carboxylate-amine ligase